MAQHTLESILQAIQDPNQIEDFVTRLANQMAPPDLNLPTQALPQAQVPQQGQAPVQAPIAVPTQGPNLGASITGRNSVINPDVAQFLQQIKLGGR